MRRLVLVKHSMPEIDPDKPASAWKLGEVGRGRAESLAAKLMEFNPCMIWSSREPKAIETAETVAGERGVPVEIAVGLEEHHRDNVPFLSSKDEFEEAVERFFLHPDELVLGMETANQARDRFAAAIDKVIGAGQTDSIVVTHGTVITLYVASVAGVQRMGFWRRLGLPSYVVLTLPDMSIRSIVDDVTLQGAQL
ncbi:MAG: phosphoglycerate mutase family protein [Chloroflexota bacterium]|nr:phosphoglycerate mutase family protein [Chloroflexota bacterium]